MNFRDGRFVNWKKEGIVVHPLVYIIDEVKISSDNKKAWSMIVIKEDDIFWRSDDENSEGRQQVNHVHYVCGTWNMTNILQCCNKIDIIAPRIESDVPLLLKSKRSYSMDCSVEIIYSRNYKSGLIITFETNFYFEGDHAAKMKIRCVSRNKAKKRA